MAAKNNNAAIRELLELLQTQPDLVRAILIDIDQAKGKRLLKTKLARGLLFGVDPRTPLPRGTIEGTNGAPSKPVVVFRCLRRSI